MHITRVRATRPPVIAAVLASALGAAAGVATLNGGFTTDSSSSRSDAVQAAAAEAAAPRAAATPVRYVALGDSVAAGIGAGSPTAEANSCWTDEESRIRISNSSKAYPHRVAGALRAALDFKAFCGANTNAVIREQLGTLNNRTNLVTVQVGANDFGFTGVLKKCIAASGGSICTDAVDKVQRDFAGKLPEKLRKVYTKIRIKAPNARVLVIGYPKIVRQQGDGCYADGLMGLSTRQKINAAAHTLNDVTEIAAQRHGFEFVDPEQALKGHAVCDKPEWINGLSNPTVESFHPNALGHEAFGRLVWQKVKP